MAETNLRGYSIDGRLNKMDVDLIDVTVSPDEGNTGAMASGDLLFTVTEIPNAVSVPGGTAILHSCMAIISPMVTGQFDCVITSASTDITEASDGSVMEPNDVVADGDNTLAELDGTCGFFSLTNGFDAGVIALANNTNIGMVCKAEAGSKSLYVWGIVKNTTDYAEGSIVLRLGFIKD